MLAPNNQHNNPRLLKSAKVASQEALSLTASILKYAIMKPYHPDERPLITLGSYYCKNKNVYDAYMKAFNETFQMDIFNEYTVVIAEYKDPMCLDIHIAPTELKDVLIAMLAGTDKSIIDRLNDEGIAKWKANRASKFAPKNKPEDPQ
jgi:hypothetical protein